MRHILPLTLIILFTSGCEKTEQSTDEPGETKAPVSGVLDTTGYQISLHSDTEGMRYTVQDSAGLVLAKEITAGEFAKRFPKIYHEGRGLWVENFIKDPWRSNESGIDNRRRSNESRFDAPGIRPNLFETPLPIPEDKRIELPPMPDFRTEDQKSRLEKFREATDQLGK